MEEKCVVSNEIGEIRVSLLLGIVKVNNNFNKNAFCAIFFRKLRWSCQNHNFNNYT